jgi:hypothetical protein
MKASLRQSYPHSYPQARPISFESNQISFGCVRKNKAYERLQAANRIRDLSGTLGFAQKPGIFARYSPLFDRN